MRGRLRRWTLRQVAKRLVGGGRRSEIARRGVAGVAVSLTRPAVGDGLRPSRDCARCSAPRASSQDRGVADLYWRPARQRRSCSSAPLRGATLGTCAPRRSRVRETATPATPLWQLLASRGKDIEVRSRRRARMSDTRGHRPTRAASAAQGLHRATRDLMPSERMVPGWQRKRVASPHRLRHAPRRRHRPRQSNGATAPALTRRRRGCARPAR